MDEETARKDQEYLKLLSIFHYIVGGIIALFSCIFIIHLILGIVVLISPEGMVDENGNPPPAFIGWIFTAIGGVAMLSGWIMAICLIFAGRSLIRKKRYLFCLIVAAVSCLFIPLGTILGIFTIVVLIRPSVKELFQAGA